MTRTEKIQAAIDALPNATGGEWRYGPQSGEVYTEGDSLVCLLHMMHQEKREPDATLISAAKELAEEVVRLRRVVEGLGPASLPTAYHTINNALDPAAEGGV